MTATWGEVAELEYQAQVDGLVRGGATPDEAHDSVVDAWVSCAVQPPKRDMRQYFRRAVRNRFHRNRVSERRRHDLDLLHFRPPAWKHNQELIADESAGELLFARRTTADYRRAENIRLRTYKTEWERRKRARLREERDGARHHSDSTHPDQ